MLRRQLSRNAVEPQAGDATLEPLFLENGVDLVLEGQSASPPLPFPRLPDPLTHSPQHPLVPAHLPRLQRQRVASSSSSSPSLSLRCGAGGPWPIEQHLRFSAVPRLHRPGNGWRLHRLCEPLITSPFHLSSPCVCAWTMHVFVSLSLFLQPDKRQQPTPEWLAYWDNQYGACRIFSARGVG